MLIRLGYSITFGIPQPTALVLMLEPHASRQTDIVVAQGPQLKPAIASHRFEDGFGNAALRLLAPPGPLTVEYDAVVNDSGLPDLVMPDAPQWPVEALPDDVLPYLLGSRYCETDRLSALAWDLFGGTPVGCQRVQAICDHVHAQIEFGYPYADATRTAAQALEGRRGVCRDFAHAAIALCRCMNIPARYCTGFLGDIGVPPVDAPMDFSAWFEAYLGGRWYTFDARHNTPRIGRVLIARGRDATDVAISTSFGATELLAFDVWTDETSDPTLTPRAAPPLAVAC